MDRLGIVADNSGPKFRYRPEIGEEGGVYSIDEPSWWSEIQIAI